MALLLVGAAAAASIQRNGGSSLTPQALNADRGEVRCNPGTYTSLNNQSNMTRWCWANCVVGFCPGDMCTCQSESDVIAPPQAPANVTPMAPWDRRRMRQESQPAAQTDEVTTAEDVEVAATDANVKKGEGHDHGAKRTDPSRSTSPT